MTDRVLSSGQAREAIQRLQQIVSGPLMEQINTLAREGQTLSQPDVWDGRLAQQFRSDWPQQHTALMRARDTLEDLRQQAQQINQNIMQAGGNQ